MRFDFFELVFNTFAILVGLFIISGFYDGVMHLKSESKYVACRVQQMEPMRYSFTDSVACVPYPTRRDTLAIQEIK